MSDQPTNLQDELISAAAAEIERKASALLRACEELASIMAKHNPTWADQFMLFGASLVVDDISDWMLKHVSSDTPEQALERRRAYVAWATRQEGEA